MLPPSPAWFGSSPAANASVAAARSPWAAAWCRFGLPGAFFLTPQTLRPAPVGHVAEVMLPESGDNGRDPARPSSWRSNRNLNRLSMSCVERSRRVSPTRTTSRCWLAAMSDGSSERQLAALVADFTGRDRFVVDNDRAAVRSCDRQHGEDVRRVRTGLADAGYDALEDDIQG